MKKLSLQGRYTAALFLTRVAAFLKKTFLKILIPSPPGVYTPWGRGGEEAGYAVPTGQVAIFKTDDAHRGYPRGSNNFRAIRFSRERGSFYCWSARLCVPLCDLVSWL